MITPKERQQLEERAAAGYRLTGAHAPSAPGKKGDISWGTAGLILVLLRLLQLALVASKDVGDIFWFISSVGIVASFVGLIISVVGIFKKSGRAAGVVGVLVYALLAVAFMSRWLGRSAT